MTFANWLTLSITFFLIGNSLALASPCRSTFAKSRYEKEITDKDFEKNLSNLIKNVDNHNHGFFGPESMLWKVTRERVLGLLSGAPIALQISHPSIAHAIVQRPDGIHQPIERFEATINVLGDFVFGDVSTAIHTARRMHKMHSHFKGQTKQTGKYSANNPELVYWVWATIFEGSLQAYQRYVQPLTKEEINQYYQESKILAQLSGTPRYLIPENYQMFQRYFSNQIENLVVTNNAKNIFDYLMSREGAGKYIDNKMTSLLRPVGLHLLPRITATQLPTSIAHQFGIQNSNGIDILLNRIRHGVAIAPPNLRFTQTYRRALERISEVP